MSRSSSCASVARKRASCSRTCSTIRSRFMISMFFSAIAACTGWPPKVMPCVYIAVSSRNGSKTRSVAITAPIAA